MKRCHIGRFVSVLRGRVVFARKVSVFYEFSDGQKEIFSEKNEGLLGEFLDSSEIVEKSELRSSV